MLKILKTPEGKKFLIAVACVFIVAVCVVSKAAPQGGGPRPPPPTDRWHAPLFLPPRAHGRPLPPFPPPLGGPSPLGFLSPLQIAE